MATSEAEYQHEPEGNRRPANLIRWAITVGIILLLIIGIIVIILVAIDLTSGKSNRPQQTCAPSKNGPPVDVYEGLLVQSYDSDALVNSSTYLFLLDEPKGFLDLKLNQVLVDTTDSRTVLTLLYDCAMIVFKIDRLLDNDYIVTMDLGLKHEGLVEKVCTSSKLNYSYKNSMRFSCLGTIVVNCWSIEKDERDTDYSKPIAEIVFNTLEFELDGDSNYIKHGEFSKSPDLFSCPHSLTKLSTSYSTDQ